MSNFKKLVRARMAKTGEGWQTAARHVRSQAPGASLKPSGAVEVLVFDAFGQYLGIIWLVPPGAPNGAIDPREGLIMGATQLRNAGRYVLVAPTGRTMHIVAERGAGGGAFMAVFVAPDTFSAIHVAYESGERDEHGMPATFARYKVVPDRKKPSAGVYAMGILPITDGATVKGVRTFGHQAWRELFALLDSAHPGLAQRIALDGAQPNEPDDDPGFDLKAHAELNEAIREAARVRAEAQDRVLKTTPVGEEAASPTTQADLDHLSAADRAYRDMLQAQIQQLRRSPPSPGAADHAFEVIVPSGGGTVTVLRGASLVGARYRARLEANSRRRSVFIRNALTGVTQAIRPYAP